MKTKKSNKNTEVSYVESAVEVAKSVASEVTDATYKTTKSIAEGTITRGEQWTKVAEKAVDGGFKLATNQQKLVFDTLETVKADVMKNKDRIKALFSLN